MDTFFFFLRLGPKTTPFFFFSPVLQATFSLGRHSGAYPPGSFPSWPYGKFRRGFGDPIFCKSGPFRVFFRDTHPTDAPQNFLSLFLPCKIAYSFSCRFPCVGCLHLIFEYRNISPPPKSFATFPDDPPTSPPLTFFLSLVSAECSDPDDYKHSLSFIPFYVAPSLFFSTLAALPPATAGLCLPPTVLRLSGKTSLRTFLVYLALMLRIFFPLSGMSLSGGAGASQVRPFFWMEPLQKMDGRLFPLKFFLENLRLSYFSAFKRVDPLLGLSIAARNFPIIFCVSCSVFFFFFLYCSDCTRMIPFFQMWRGLPPRDSL